jgi:hypothetical protein
MQRHTRNQLFCLQAPPLIEIKSSLFMKGNTLFERGAGLTCTSTQQFKLILQEKRQTKLTLNQREARGASAAALISDDDY